MHYSHYPSAAHNTQPAVHPSQSSDEYPLSYSDSSHHHSTLPYAAVTPAAHLSTGSVAHQNITAQYSYAPYATQAPQAPPADQHSYYTTSSQGHAVDHYPSSSSPLTSYAAPTTPPSQLSPQASRHHVQQLPQQRPPPPPPQQQQQQQQFIPTPVQAYQSYPSAGSNSTGRSRSSVEPYYRMSPNPQHVVHAPPASTTHATTGGGSNAAHGPGPSHHHNVHAHTHMSTINAAPGERYPCDLCDRSFTRLHDRRRHYETVHATSPVLHKCRYCRKDFSRADSLKRHIDNGCDEMPR